MRVCGTSYSSSASPASSLRGRTPANPRRLNPLWSASIFPITLDIPPSSRCRNTSTLVSTRSTSQPKPRDEEAPMLPPTHFRRLSIATPGPLRPEGRAPPSFSFSPSENGSPVLEAALAVLESERARVAAEKSALEQSLADGTITDPKARARILREIRERTLDLGHSDLELQSRFLSRQSAKSPVNASEPESITLADLKRKRFEGFVVPRLLRAANQAGLFVDAFPGLIDEAKLPEANLEVNFGRITQGWEGCYGHPIPPNWALNSPGITITLPDDPTIDNAEPRLFTLIMADLDRPNPNTRSVEEWCHWLVTNIPVRPGHPLVVPEGSSPYLGPPITAGLDSLVGTSLHPSPAAEPAAWPAGSSVVLPYVPLHPANENPRRLHRYVFALLEQSKPLDIQVEPLRLRAIEREVEPLKKVPQWQRRVESEAEVKLGVCERGGISIWGMAKEHGLKLAGYAFVRSIWNVYTSEIFTRLGKLKAANHHSSLFPSAVNPPSVL
ncbi:hypothetical protein DFJ73DRAFT_403006 [Zopfochytrium polystomum]|nr:hypothetical protein DFJ73DRAFT_403006 [Zopfochytrium polystomum]